MSQSPLEERRLLLAVALSLLVLTGYRLLMPPAPRAQAPASGPAAAATAPAPAALPEASPAPPAVPVQPVEADERERRIEVQGRDLDLAFTNKGARLVSWKLERFRDASGRPEEMVQVSPEGPRPLDLE